MSDDTLWEVEGKDRVRGVIPSRLYWLDYGRNAWRSTWITRYQEYSLHFSLTGAQAYTERLRKQGSVFYISEMPCLHFIGETFSLLVTQINTTNPLGDFSIRAPRDRLPANVRWIDAGRTRAFKIGMPLHEVWRAFEHNSRFWKVPQRAKNSVVRKTSLTMFKTEMLDGRRFHRWQSASCGPRYRLQWNQTQSDMKREGVMRVLRDITSFENCTIRGSNRARL